MILDAAAARKYPKLAYYIKNNLPEAYKVPSIAYALKKVGQFDRRRLREALRRNFDRRRG